MAVVERFRERDDEKDEGVEGWWKEDGRWQHGRRRRKDEKLLLVRNHEGDVGNPYLANNPALTYAPQGVRTGAGGTTNLVFNLTQGKCEAACRASPAPCATAPAA